MNGKYEWSLCTLCGGIGLGGGMKGYCAPAQRCLGPVTTVTTINLKLLSCQRLAADVALSGLSRWPIIRPWAAYRVDMQSVKVA